jgi:hypothetical protein
MNPPRVVAKDDTEEVVAPEPESEGPKSPLELLKGKREALDAELYLDVPVPRWEKVLGGRQLWVRYKPGDPALFNTTIEKREQKHRQAMKGGAQGDPHYVAKANAEFLIDACLAVYDLAIGEKPPKNLPEELPTFSSPELSEALGAGRTAISTVLKVFGTEGDVMLAASQLLAWSGQVQADGDESFLVS